MKYDWKNKVAVITGASSGIGAATARHLVKHGLNVVLVARRLDLKEHIEAMRGKAKVIAADLSHETDRVRVFASVQAEGGADVLINNAGFGWYGYYNEMPWETAREMLEVNIGVTVQLTSQESYLHPALAERHTRVELSFGWLEDWIGPLLLKRQQT
jgi:short-subunit dehydrogenase